MNAPWLMKSSRSMNSDAFKAARKAYSYVPARLVEVTGSGACLVWGNLYLSPCMPLQDAWNTCAGRRQSQQTSIKLDEYHRDLLNAEADDEILLGLLSTVFWGYASGLNGRFTVERALSKARQFFDGRGAIRPQARTEILRHLCKTRELLEVDRVADALREAMKIKFLGMSFASKALMFMNPSKAAVYDRVIGERLAGSCDSKIRTLGVKQNGARIRLSKPDIYAEWCAWCSEKATFLNHSGCQWQDWDGTLHDWRAVDVERAFYAQPATG